LIFFEELVYNIEVPIRDIFIVFKNNIDFSDIKLIEEK
jgi:hypothetical protein